MASLMTTINVTQQRPGSSRWLFPVLIMLTTLLLSLSGCATKPSRTQELLATDYMAMSNDDLLLYYYRLDDQVEAEESTSTGSAVSIGIGTGFFGSGSHVGGGVGVSTGTGSQTIATDLRNRKNVVRLELQKRGVRP